MTKFFIAAVIAISTLAGNAMVSHAGYFGDQKQTQEGQNLPGTFGQIEKSGI
jgi:hypothetical protein